VSDYLIRAAVESDLDSLVALKLALQDHMELSNPTIYPLSPVGRAEVRTELAKQPQEDGTLVLLAESAQGEAIGMVIGQVQHQTRLLPETLANIGVLYVKDHWRRYGVGTALVNRLLGFFAERDAEEISVRYVVGNKEAERFWEGLGFERRIITAGASRKALASRLD
jgi:ribosomal protein S18 acetylase RimI-like enzyme